MDNRKYSIDEISVIVNSVLGKTFGELNRSSLNEYNKGSFGHILEEDVFGYDINSFSEPDFIDAGIELKVTPYKINKDKSLSAKERLVLNVIDYDNEYKNKFKSSHFWFKNNKIQIIWYLWEENKKRDDYILTNEKLLDLSVCDDLNQIEEDWNTIIEKIKEGKAHEISEADTMYLGACTKGATAESSFRSQPFSDILAKQRAFCFKTSYMTQLVRKYIGDYSNVEKIINNVEETFDSFINRIVTKYKGKTQRELMQDFNIQSDAKNINSMIVSRMFGVKGCLNETEEFMKANIIPRTIRIEENGNIKESMPFKAFKFCDIVNEEWESSKLKEMFETTKYMFFVFKMEQGEYVFKGIKLWNMPENLLEEHVKQMWEMTKNIVSTGNIVKSINEKGERTTNFPGMSSNPICHVRPHARDKNDTFPLPIPDKLTGLRDYMKHCFWVNDKYLEMILTDFNN